MKVLDWAGIELLTSGSAVIYESLVRHVTNCAMWPGQLFLCLHVTLCLCTPDIGMCFSQNEMCVREEKLSSGMQCFVFITDARKCHNHRSQTTRTQGRDI